MGYEKREKMKQIIKIYIEEEDKNRLIIKAKACGFEGRGLLSHYITKIAREYIIFVTPEVVKVFKEGKKLKGG